VNDEKKPSPDPKPPAPEKPKLPVFPAGGVRKEILTRKPIQKGGQKFPIIKRDGNLW